MKAIAPGKLILSGEHAVVYGKPALAMAIDLSAQSEVTLGRNDEVSFNLLDFNEKSSYTLRALRSLQQRLSKNYQLFLNGDLSIRQVLYKPVELFQFAFIVALDGLHLKLTDGLDISCTSTIPIGCGLGSSAATILSTLRAVGHYFRVEFKPEWTMEYSLAAEKMQHGFPSGVDSYISLNGGCALFRGGEAQAVRMPRSSLCLVYTGTPESTTGECVERVRQQHAADTIWNDFEAVTQAMEQALTAEDREQLCETIDANDRLLRKIGVAPLRVQQFIDELKTVGGVAKICGAGAVRGDRAGALLVLADEPPTALCEKYGYTIMSVRGDPLGARIV